MKILSLGSLNIDRVYRIDRFVEAGETKAAESMMVNCGGKGLNQSIAAAKAGCEVFHAGLLGSDGQMLKDALSKSGVDVSLLLPYDGPSGHAIIEVDDHGQNRIILFGGSNRALTEQQVDHILESFGSQGVVLLQNEINLLPYIMEQAAARGLEVIFNAAPMGKEVLSYPLEKLRWLIVNEVEGKAIAECASEQEVIPALSSRYPQMGILLTLGKGGAILYDHGHQARIPSQQVKAVDTTAAGDTFIGYFLYGLLHQLPAAEMLQLATGASAIAVTRPGASISIPSRTEVEEALNQGVLKKLEVEEQ